MFVKNMVRELQFMKASVLSLTFTFQHFHSLLESVVKCQPGVMKAWKIINYKKNCLSNEDQCKSSYWGKQSYMQKHSNAGTQGSICILTAGAMAGWRKPLSAVDRSAWRALRPVGRQVAHGKADVHQNTCSFQLCKQERDIGIWWWRKPSFEDFM